MVVAIDQQRGWIAEGRAVGMDTSRPLAFGTLLPRHRLAGLAQAARLHALCVEDPGRRIAPCEDGLVARTERPLDARAVEAECIGRRPPDVSHTDDKEISAHSSSVSNARS